LPNSSININSTLLHFAIFTLFLAQMNTYRLCMVSHILTKKCEFLRSFASKILSSILCVYNTQLFLNWQSLRFVLLYEEVVMLLICSVINGTTQRKLYSHKQSEANTEYVNFTHRILQIIEIKVKQLVTKWSIKSMFIHIVNYTQATTLPHTVWNASAAIDGSACGMWHHLPSRCHRLALSCISVPLKYCGNCDIDEPL